MSGVPAPPSRLARAALWALTRALQPDRWPPPRQHQAPSRAAWRPGVSVLIPECGTPDLLARALSGLVPALQALSEPSEVLVVVNGAHPAQYLGLRQAFPQVRWLFKRRALGFGGAVACGLGLARHGAVYLHNSDMVLETDSLALLMPWRLPQVFAVASQIHFDDPAKRREETGWGALDWPAVLPRLFDRTPEPDVGVRSALYAGGGASLFDADLLRRFAAHTQSYVPFYWEDADWGLQAWQCGLEVLFQPASVAWHRHRATVARLYAPTEIERIVGRNARLFALRHAAHPEAVLADLGQQAPRTLRELLRPVVLKETWQMRRARHRAPFAALDATARCQSVHARPSRPDGRPLVLLVSPYRLLPPLHGGAKRTWHLCQALSPRWRFVLLSDEAAGHGHAAWEHLAPFDSVHLVDGRPDGPQDRIGRIRSHSHPALRAELARLVAVYQPDVLQIEHVELAGLLGEHAVPTVLVAHDVLLGSDADVAADAFERHCLARADALVTCCAEDAALLAPLPAQVVPNGAVALTPCAPSQGRLNLLLAGPFRYAPNLQGLRVFLAQVFPALRCQFSGLQLTVLAGDGWQLAAAQDPLLRLPGVRLVSAVSDVRPWLEACTLTINPLEDTRGSSVKLVESLMAGRVCVSTRTGARGFLQQPWPGLRVVDNIAAMGKPIAELLAKPAWRHALEQANPTRQAQGSWESAAVPMEQVYRQLLRL